MSTRMPPRGRGPSRPPNKPTASREEPKTQAPPRPQTNAAGPEPVGRRKRYDYVIIGLIVVVLAALIIKVPATGTASVNFPGITLNKTAKPGKSAQAAATAGVAVKNRPIITEILSSNKGTVTTEKGVYSDWIELYNPTDQTINLAGFMLSDNVKKATKSVLPSYMLEAGKYVVIFADDGTSTKDELHVSFKLKSSGTQLVLTDPNGNAVQTIACPALETDHSYAMDASDSSKWSITDKNTPGFPNTNEGSAAYQQTRYASAPIGLNEVMAGNSLTIKDSDGDYSDWVELYNPTDKAVDLTGWGLSNRESEPKRWVFPAMKIESKQYLVVFVSGKNRTDAGKELHTNFRLNGYKDTILLSNVRGQIVSKIDISNLKSDTSYGMVPGTDKWQVFTHPTPGYPNNEDGWNALQPKVYNNANESIVINEVMSNNVSSIQDQFQEYPDWIELYNRSDKSVNLKGYGLTDKSNELGRWKFPDITVGPGQYLTVFASGRNLTDADAVTKKKLHTDFSISGTGSIIALTAPDGHIADRCFVPALKAGDTYGRNKQSLFNYITDPTPGSANADGYPGQASDPLFSIKAGMYDSQQKVELSTDDASAKIYYTLDGKTPTQSSAQYTGPIDVTKTTAVRAVAYRDGYLPSNATCSTYLISEGISIPVVSIVTDPDNLFSSSTGIYAKGPNAAGFDATPPYKGANFYQKWERPAHVELLMNDGTVALSQDIGIKIFGAYSRKEAYKGLALIARAKYGKNSMDYAIFPDQPYTSYKSVVLRPGGQEVSSTGVRDVLITSLVHETSDLDVQDYRPVVLFVNGEFWGVNYIREKITNHYLAQHYNLDETQVSLLEGNGNIIKAGNSKDYKALVQYVKDHDLSVKANYDYVASKVDIDSIIDWYACEIMTGNSDTGNIRFWKSNAADAKWKWIYYDFCWGFWPTKINRSDIQIILNPEGNGAGGSHAFSTALINGLLKNSEFRDKFLSRLAYHINVTFEPNRVLARLQQITDEVEPYMDRTFKKWDYGGVSTWNKHLDQMKDYINQHPALVKQQMQNYFHLSDAQMQKYFK